MTNPALEFDYRIDLVYRAGAIIKRVVVTPRNALNYAEFISEMQRRMAVDGEVIVRRDTGEFVDPCEVR